MIDHAAAQEHLIHQSVTLRGDPPRDDVVHLRIKPHGVHNAQVYCGYGSYHVKWCGNIAKVTCPQCLSKARGK